MNKVERAVILAAGVGNRMHPITFTTPKPLIKVNGVRMIESIILGLRLNGIKEIYIVTGYLNEQFDYLQKKYGAVLIENPYYQSCNNISSLYVARLYIHNTMILDGDQIIHNPAVLDPFFERSGYNAIWTDEKTDEWVMTLENGIVTGCSRTGGEKGWQLFSISRWNDKDGKKLRQHLEMEFEMKRNRQIYWDDIPMFCHLKEYELGIREMKRGDVIEIDNYAELAAIDSSYEEEKTK